MSEALLRALRAKSGGVQSFTEPCKPRSSRRLVCLLDSTGSNKKSMKRVAKPHLGRGGSAEPAAILDAPWA